MNNTSNNNYDDVLCKLQPYMLTDSKINECITTSCTTTSCKRIIKNNNNNNNNKNSEIKEVVFIPKENDTLFWCFYIMKHGDLSYEMLEKRNFITEKKLKIEYIEKIRKEKQVVKFHKFTTLTHLENALANETKIDVNTFLTLCAIENLNVIYINKKTFFEIVKNDTNVIYILHSLNNHKYGFEINIDDKVIKIRESLFKLDDINKQIKAISFYKIDELVDICKKLEIETVNKETNKKKSKKDLYELLVQYF